ncbi:versican core protein-like [Carcharodon carcharias]|uniref:versican core protein-like n=1 Tax=Carcharodon carcharias TaxID=13397 RepID=UPI001B7ED6B5|nr:versican core protein-like [Carcharodon carcharias]
MATAACVLQAGEGQPAQRMSMNAIPIPVGMVPPVLNLPSLESLNASALRSSLVTCVSSCTIPATSPTIRAETIPLALPKATGLLSAAVNWDLKELAVKLTPMSASPVPARTGAVAGMRSTATDVSVCRDSLEHIVKQTSMNVYLDPAEIMPLAWILKMSLRCEANINDCASAPCQNKGTCIDAISGYSCICLKGFAGINCEHNVDECVSNPCLHGMSIGRLVHCCRTANASPENALLLSLALSCQQSPKVLDYLFFDSMLPLNINSSHGGWFHMNNFDIHL